MKKYVDKKTIKKAVMEKLLKACGRLYESERALCELVVPQSWKDEAKCAWEEFVWRYQDYELVFENSEDITADELNYDYEGLH